MGEWLHKQAQVGMGLLVIGGCTTTSCVRVSAQQIARQLRERGLAGRMRVVVDLNLCGARRDNYRKDAEEDPVLVRTYGRDFCLGKSAVDLAVVQMRQAGVQVIDGFPWAEVDT